MKATAERRLPEDDPIAGIIARGTTAEDLLRGDQSAAGSRSRFRFLDDVAIERLPPPQWRVVDHVPDGGFAVVYSPPEGAKTFWALALAFSVATGLPFFGRKTRRGPVVYVAAEGSAGLPVRVGAWKHSNEWYDRAGVYFVTQPVQLLDVATVAAFVAALETLPEMPALIVFDTLHRCMAGGDENSARDMGIAVQAVDTIRRVTSAAVMTVHHTRKDGDAERGSTSLRGAADSMISLKREQERITVSCEKQKDAPHFAPYFLELARVQDSCVLVTAGDRSAVTTLFPGDPKHQALSILHSSSLEDGLSTTAWLKASGMKERTFYESRRFLVASGYVDRAPKKGAPNVITAKGKHTVTANCNVTADDTAAQSAAVTACASPSLRRAQQRSNELQEADSGELL